MRDRDGGAEGLRPFRHAAEGEHEAGEQDRRQHVEEGHLHRLQLCSGEGGDQEAEGEAADDKQKHAEAEGEPAAAHGDLEEDGRHDEDHGGLHQADDHIGRELADHHLDGLGGGGEQAFHRAALDLARDGEGGHHHEGHRQDDAEQAGDDVVGGDALRVVAALDDDFEGRRGGGLAGHGALEIVGEGLLGQGAGGGEGGVGGGGVGGVGFEEDLRAIATRDAQRSESNRRLDMLLLWERRNTLRELCKPGM